MDKAGKFFTNKWILVICALLCCALWGSASPFIKLGSSLMVPSGDIPSILVFAGCRFAFAGLLTIVIYSVIRRKVLYPKRENIKRILTVCSFQTILQYIFFYVGLAYTSSVKGTVITSSSAFAALLIASLIFRSEKLTAKKVVACVLAFSGIVCINLKGLDLNMNFFGDGFALFSAICTGFSSVLIKRYSKYEDPVTISGYQFMIGGIILVLVGVAFGGRIVIESALSFGVLTYLALLSAVAYSLWSMLLKYNPVSKVTIYTFTQPICGVLLSEIMLSESSNVEPLNLVLALVLVCGGILLLNYNKEKAK